MEPPWADNCSMDLSAWQTLSDCMATLALRNAALETLLEVPLPISASTLPCQTQRLRRS